MASIVLLLGVCASKAGAGEVSPTSSAACAAQPAGKGSSRQRFDSVPLMTIENEVESQGEADFHVKFDEPTAECLVESFSIADVKVIARYSPFEKGLSTLLYRFSVERPTGASEVLVVYSGMASLIGGGGYVFHVSEEKEGIISWYAMYRDDPPFAEVKALVQQIIAGSAKPLLAVRWPKGAKKSEVVVFDQKRLR